MELHRELWLFEMKHRENTVSLYRERNIPLDDTAMRRLNLLQLTFEEWCAEYLESDAEFLARTTPSAPEPEPEPEPPAEDSTTDSDDSRYTSGFTTDSDDSRYSSEAEQMLGPGVEYGEICGDRFHDKYEHTVPPDHRVIDHTLYHVYQATMAGGSSEWWKYIVSFGQDIDYDGTDVYYGEQTVYVWNQSGLHLKEGIKLTVLTTSDGIQHLVERSVDFDDYVEDEHELFYHGPVYEPETESESEPDDPWTAAKDQWGESCRPEQYCEYLNREAADDPEREVECMISLEPLNYKYDVETKSWTFDYNGVDQRDIPFVDSEWNHVFKRGYLVDNINHGSANALLNPVNRQPLDLSLFPPDLITVQPEDVEQEQDDLLWMNEDPNRLGWEYNADGDFVDTHRNFDASRNLSDDHRLQIDWISVLSGDTTHQALKQARDSYAFAYVLPEVDASRGMFVGGRDAYRNIPTTPTRTSDLVLWLAFNVVSQYARDGLTVLSESNDAMTEDELRPHMTTLSYSKDPWIVSYYKLLPLSLFAKLCNYQMVGGVPDFTTMVPEGQRVDIEKFVAGTPNPDDQFVIICDLDHDQQHIRNSYDRREYATFAFNYALGLACNNTFDRNIVREYHTGPPSDFEGFFEWYCGQRRSVQIRDVVNDSVLRSITLPDDPLPDSITARLSDEARRTYEGYRNAGYLVEVVVNHAVLSDGTFGSVRKFTGLRNEDANAAKDYFDHLCEYAYDEWELIGLIKVSIDGSRRVRSIRTCAQYSHRMQDYFTLSEISGDDIELVVDEEGDVDEIVTGLEAAPQGWRARESDLAQVLGPGVKYDKVIDYEFHPVCGLVDDEEERWFHHVYEARMTDGRRLIQEGRGDEIWSYYVEFGDLDNTNTFHDITTGRYYGNHKVFIVSGECGEDLSELTDVKLTFVTVTAENGSEVKYLVQREKNFDNYIPGETDVFYGGPLN